MGKRLVKAGHKVTLITSYARFPDSYNFTRPVTELEIEGINLKVLKIPYSNNMSFTRRIWAFISFALSSIKETMKTKEVDLIFTTSTPLTIAVPGILGKRFHKCPMVFEVRDLWPELPIAIGALKNPLMKRAARKLEKYAYHNSEAIVALSPGMKEGIVKTGYPEEKVTVIPNSCDIDLFDVPASRGIAFLNKHPELKGEALITYAGTLGLINGVDYLVEIASEMEKINPNIRFAIFGKGREKEKVMAKAKELGMLDKNLFIYPPLPKKEIPDLLSATTIATSLFIDLPEMWNNSANKFFDALAAGKPLMINYQGWQAKILQETGAGIVVPPNKPEETALRLNSLIQDQQKIQKAQKNAQELAYTKFNRNLLGEKLISIFEDIFSTPPDLDKANNDLKEGSNYEQD